MPLLYNYDAMLYGRWEYWTNLQLVPKDKLHLITQEEDPDQRLANIQQHILPNEPIPQIDFDTTYTQGDRGRKMLEICLDKMLTRGGYVNIMTRIEYLLDWVLYGLGHPHPWFKELPLEPSCCEGASMVLYQLFDLFPLLDNPKDYWGNLIADAKSKGSQKHTGYFPTPNTVANFLSQIMFCDSKDTRLETGCEPTIGTGVMTLGASNQVLSMVGIDIDKILLKACLFSWYMYCPWFAQPVWYLLDRTDLMWGNALVSPPHDSAPESIHQKYWRQEYQDIYPVALETKDWQQQMAKIVDLMPKPPQPPGMTSNKSDDKPNKESSKTKKGKIKKKSVKGFKRPATAKKHQPLF